MGDRISRRDLFKALGGLLIAGIAGHTPPYKSYADPGHSDITIEASFMAQAGKFKALIKTGHSKEIASVRISLNGEEGTEKVSISKNQQKVELVLGSEDIHTIKPGEINQITAIVKTSSGSTETYHLNQYIRKYDVLKDTKIYFGAVYMPWMGSKWGRCLPKSFAKPKVGQYDSTRHPTAVNRHIDQMQGHGIDTLMYNYNGKDSEDWQFHELAKKDLYSAINVEPFYVIAQVLRWTDYDLRTRLKEDFEFIKKNMIDTDMVKTYEGSPVVGLWGVNWPVWSGDPASREAKDQIMSEWGSWGNFVDFIREGLTVNGEEPYLMAEVRQGLFHNRDKYGKLDRHFDALTTWTGFLRTGRKTNWSKAWTFLKRNYRAVRDFAASHDQDFIPMVFPGFDDRKNSCWGGDGYLPRSLSRFTDMLDLADKYRTRDRINIATWNDWTEGHQIEPGSFGQSDYGTSFLDKLKTASWD